MNSRPCNKKHVIAVNVSVHKAKQVTASFTEHPRVRTRFPSTNSSLLIRVERWFATVERDVIAQGFFTSLIDLKRKLMRVVSKCKEPPKPV